MLTLKVTCALCKADYPASYMDIHLKKEHNIEEDPSLGPKVLLKLWYYRNKKEMSFKTFGTNDSTEQL